MDLKKLPPSMLLALGLACGDDTQVASTSSGGGTCLSPATDDVGPCLSPPDDGIEGCLSPCLDSTADWSTGDSGPAGTSTGGTSTGGTSTGGTSTGGSSGTDDSGSGSDTGEATGTTGVMEAPPERVRAVRRLLDRGALPPDVAARLRAELPED